MRINRDNNPIAARRLENNVLGVFHGACVQEHVTHGSAVTVHSHKASPPTQHTLSAVRALNADC